LRRFLVLLSGLSAQARWWSFIEADNELVDDELARDLLARM